MEQRGALFTAILSRAAGEDIPELDSITAMAFSFISSQLDRDFAKWEDTRAKRVAAGREGGKASGKTRKQKQANEANASISKQNEANVQRAKQNEANEANVQRAKQNEANEAVNVDVNVDGNVNGDVDSVYIGQPSVAEDTRPNFVPPTLEEVEAYCQERKNNISPQRFIDYYEARGWMLGNTPMESWKAAIRSWESGHTSGEPPGKPRTPKLRLITDENGNEVCVCDD